MEVQDNDDSGGHSFMRVHLLYRMEDGALMGLQLVHKVLFEFDQTSLIKLTGRNKLRGAVISA